MKVKVSLAIVAAVVVAAVTLLAVSTRRRQQQMREVREQMIESMSRVEEGSKLARATQIAHLDRMEKDDNVIRSILQGLEISIEIQPQWAQDREFLIQVDLNKPDGKRYLVDAIEESCILYVDNRPWALLRHHRRSHDRRKSLPANLGSSHPVFRVHPDIPENSELIVEWVNYNPRSNKIERLRTAPYHYTGRSVEEGPASEWQPAAVW